jgi:hypothetical protein
MRLTGLCGHACGGGGCFGDLELPGSSTGMSRAAWFKTASFWCVSVCVQLILTVCCANVDVCVGSSGMWCVGTGHAQVQSPFA